MKVQKHDSTKDTARRPENWARSGDDERKDAASHWDPELDQRLDDEWFQMGDQWSWMEVRPHERRSWETARRN